MLTLFLLSKGKRTDLKVTENGELDPNRTFGKPGDRSTTTELLNSLGFDQPKENSI